MKKVNKYMLDKEYIPIKEILESHLLSCGKTLTGMKKMKIQLKNRIMSLNLMKKDIEANIRQVKEKKNLSTGIKYGTLHRLHIMYTEVLKNLEYDISEARLSYKGLLISVSNLGLQVRSLDYYLENSIGEK